jgi:hypothetical protein
MIAGSCFQAYERKNTEYLDIIKGKHTVFTYKKLDLD